MMQMQNNIILSENLPLISEVEKQTYIEKFVEKMGSGEHDVFEMYIQVKQLESMFSEILKHPKVIEILDLEAKNNDPKINRCGFVIERASKSTYKYDNDSVYIEMEKALKDRQTMLKNIPASGLADPETGEMLYPPLRKVSEFFKLTNKNK